MVWWVMRCPFPSVVPALVPGLKMASPKQQACSNFITDMISPINPVKNQMAAQNRALHPPRVHCERRSSAKTNVTQPRILLRHQPDRQSHTSTTTLSETHSRRCWAFLWLAKVC
ncbi:hypothetical protein B0T21DRAFT_100116 [Apiosordaria backusii]|uniref:Uncharacterized protein n=1 Tax=Apiosordaria backusii TaxID=314023 RepID=A0AA40K455_9PEZI|nr:hypothetical protein B0T21DRAFT_100116 [Apiosordaria backusii]